MMPDSIYSQNLRRQHEIAHFWVAIQKVACTRLALNTIPRMGFCKPQRVSFVSDSKMGKLMNVRLCVPNSGAWWTFSSHGRSGWVIPKRCAGIDSMNLAGNYVAKDIAVEETVNVHAGRNVEASISADKTGTSAGCIHRA